MLQKILNFSRAQFTLGLLAGALILNANAAFAEKNTYFNNFNFDSSVLTESDTKGHAGKLSGAPIQERHTFLSDMATQASDVVVSALNMIGVRYRWGGNTPNSGLDCSGFVRYVFQDALGLTLPRRAVEMSRVGAKIKMTDLRPGDLVFFNTMRRTFSHVGIYIGDNKFVHSPSTGNNIRVDRLDNRYWGIRYTGARRVEALLAG
ncbi:C40 family peptidase [Mycoavidus sp. B2-EB]|uniref:C40 family peptidase n=1 Tax=Mycoavidus sp. B2-EB TaxID=2651972 RepID=UPI00162AF410|nr:C40 family peptidase [Mycoavidus sp. B2-EB]BBO59864.1 peptidase P60 [Mycoavidus sp. B2-EB]